MTDYRLTNNRGDVLTVSSKEQVDYWGALGYRAEGSSGATKDTGYDDLKVDELKAEIDSRNDGRDEGDLISTDGKKADLIAALEADDAANS